jgi:outer membrane protein assembly factor BamB
MSAALLVLLAACDDWPTWRYDPARTAASPQELAPELHLQWSRALPPTIPPWPDQVRMAFDHAYEPVVAGGTLFLASSRDDGVAAYDARTGVEKWRFFADGPVRFAPTVREGRLYFGADDGHLYCLDAATGSLAWKLRAAPSDSRLLGNGRLISMWPARGAPVVVDGTVYVAAGIWPFMGTFLHAADARTGRVLWTQDGDGSAYMQQPHRAEAFAGVAPQGPLAVIGDHLLVPGGRSVPACYDRRTGKQVHFRFVENGKRGGFEVCVAGAFVHCGGFAFDLATGYQVGETGRCLVPVGDLLYFSGKDKGIQALTTPATETYVLKLKTGEKLDLPRWKKASPKTIDAPRIEAMIRAGSRLYAGAEKSVFAVDPATSRIVWTAEVEGTPLSLAAADDRIYVSTREGRVYCFGASKVEPVVHALPRPTPAVADVWTGRAREILETTRAREGWCVAWGVGSGRLAAEIALQSGLRVVAVELDAAKAAAARRRLAEAGLHADRVAVVSEGPLPPYFASLAVAEDASAVPDAARAFASLRPLGGVACLPVPAERREAFRRAVSEAFPGEPEVVDAGDAILLSRPRALPGSGDWTHEHGDAANTRVARDLRVKAPLGLLWFGGPSHEGILPRHGHGPQPQVIDGRLFIEGVNLLRAMDIYTGRVLWETRLPGVGGFYNNLAHQPGANASGTNFVSTSDGIYAVVGRSCVRLDPATGAKLSEFTLPLSPGAKEPPLWGYINVVEDLLVGGAEPLAEAGPLLVASTGTGDDPDPEDKAAMDLMKKLSALKSTNDNLSSSKRLVVMDRRSGKVLWQAAARLGFRHNAVVAGAGRLYAIDRLSGPQQDRMKKRGETAPAKPRLVAFDLRTGRELWSSEEDVFGTWLSYSAKHDVLVEACRVARDTLKDESKGMRAWKADRGTELWRKDHSGPAMIHGDTILMTGKACDLLSGAIRMREHPLTGEKVEWTWTRAYGCNTPAASEHLLTFRSGAAGYYDLLRDGGTGNFGGFRSSCTYNLIVAGGIITVPDYTRTCSCSYQNQTSLALVPMADVEMWTYAGYTDVKGVVRRVGINLGAPGDRRADGGTLWLEHPSVAGKSPAVAVKTDPATPALFRRHSTAVSGALPWVAASGATGLSSLTVTLDPEAREGRLYTVRLHFLEPDDLAPGRRVFHVSLQGREALRGLDVVREAGGPRRAVVKEFSGVRVRRDLVVALLPVAGEPVLCGVEAVAEGR